MYKSRKGFTLIELLIVTVVIVTLMGVVFRLAGAGTDSKARSITIRRMQCLENALSGYYAAYGSYPPVPLQGRSRSIFAEVDTYGVQGSNERGQELNPLRIHQACRAQPVAAVYPPRHNTQMDRSMEKLSEACTFYYKNTSKYKNKFRNLINPGGIKANLSEWGESKQGANSVQLFQFGLMSFLLPRYFFMFKGDQGFYGNTGQWGNNNQLPSRLDTGTPFASWGEIRKIMGGDDKDGRITDPESGMISNLTSQSVCARWMPNLQGIVTGGGEYYGINTAVVDNDDSYYRIPHGWVEGIEYGELHIHSRNGHVGEGGSGGDLYILECQTVRDGWHMDYYYYSEPPYQSYRLWSAGPNRLTFPPWYDINQFSSSDISKIKEYVKDDFVHMSN